jgi:hypothetical protein
MRRQDGLLKERASVPSPARDTSEHCHNARAQVVGKRALAKTEALQVVHYNAGEMYLEVRPGVC